MECMLSAMAAHTQMVFSIIVILILYEILHTFSTGSMHAWNLLTQIVLKDLHTYVRENIWATVGVQRCNG